MELCSLKKNDLERVLNLFCTCFVQDHYYMRLFKNEKDRSSAMRNAFSRSIEFCLVSGLSLGAFDDGRLVAFALLIDYNRIKNSHRDIFNEMFGSGDGSGHLFNRELHRKITGLTGDTLFLLSIAVAPEYRNRGLASAIIDYILAAHRDFNIVSDVSNEESLGIYKKRNFEIAALGDRYYYIEHLSSSPVATVDFSGKIRLIVPNRICLDRYGVDYICEKEACCLIGYDKVCDCETECFIKREGHICTGTAVSLEYSALLKYQRAINISQYTECTEGDHLLYVQKIRYSQSPLLNNTLEQMIEVRSSEWSLIPDVFVSVPMQYFDCEKIRLDCSDRTAGALLKDMDFRTHYEAGIPSDIESVDDLSGFKKRIERYYLGKVKIQIYSEITAENYSQSGDAIGPAAFVDLFISVDSGSNCAVLTWYSLSSPFLVSHLFDNIIRNQLMVVENGNAVNFYDYIKNRFGLIKRGTPKIFAVFPNSKNALSDSQLASLLAGETIYPDGENFGKIIDSDILSAVKSEYGMGQYDRAFVCAYTNTVLQFSKDFSGSVTERLFEESITLFYIELILFEEAAIHIADRKIIKLFTSDGEEDPIDFLAKADEIYDGYSETIDFWGITVNYPTSQRSIEMLRKAFRIKEQLEAMMRNKEQLQTVFNTKCDMIDRKESKRMDTSLAIISLFAVFSAWMEGHNYITTWSDVISQNTILIMQRSLFIIVSLIAIYAIIQLFGHKFAMSLRKKRKRKREKPSK